MGYRVYPDYKESGVTGLDRVPSHWTTWKATHGFSRIGSGTTPKSDNASYYDGDIPWVTTRELREKPILETQAKLTAQAIRDYPTLKTYSPHSLIIAMYGATIGRLGILEIEATVNQACCVFSDPEQFDTKFFYYWLWMWRPTLLALSAGGGQPNLSQDTLKQIRVPAPSVPEQQKIAKFLDHKTAQIDRLIEKKQELIAKFHEQRTAIINQAVTGGVRKNVTLKSSGIEWLGDIPSHWDIWRLRFSVTMSGGMTPSTAAAQYWEGSIPWVTPKDMKSDRITSSIDMLTEIALQETSLQLHTPKQVLIVVRGMILAHTFPVGINDVNVTINQDMKALSTTLNPEYLAILLRGFQSVVLSIVEESAHGTKVLRTDLFKDIPLPVPPEQEQEAIVAYIHNVIAKSDLRIEAVDTAIDRLQEYRTALITAAVTGQIDVRDFRKEQQWR
ncbi:restriction endonuclease subunit S [Pseudomonas sp. WHRI 8822A]|uniref:restriction endonuclease subunit S n=1 Tax=Pseudomonas sp. WHRI 8822A TaxID=3162568 RepID=UPI0032F001C9